MEYVAPFDGGLHYAGQEKTNPVNKVIAQADSHQGIVITGAIPLEIGGKVQGRLGQELVIDQIERYQKASDTPIAIQKRVDGLKLIMTDGDAD